MKNYKINIGYLYGEEMNIYGDTGNVIALKKRCEWRGIEVDIKAIGIRQEINRKEFDLYFWGGGQDESQVKVAEDIKSLGKDEILRLEAERGVPMLAICGGYQLLGKYYQTGEGEKIPGIGLIDAYTIGGIKRMIGNVTVQSKHFGTIVGFENHSGKTYLGKRQEALGRVVKGFGNNGEDRTEGVIYKNAIGCYLHGSLLPKNPQVADWLTQKALEVKYGEEIKLEKLGDEWETEARKLVV